MNILYETWKQSKYNFYNVHIYLFIHMYISSHCILLNKNRSKGINVYLFCRKHNIRFPAVLVLIVETAR